MCVHWVRVRVRVRCQVRVRVGVKVRLRVRVRVRVKVRGHRGDRGAMRRESWVAGASQSRRAWRLRSRWVRIRA